MLNTDTLLAIVGPTGAGKTTLLQEVLGDNLSKYKIVSHTTRLPREGEVDGVDYHFSSMDDLKDNTGFTTRILRDEYAGNYYWVNRQDIQQKLSAEHFAAIIVTVKGLDQLLHDKMLAKNTVGLFLTPSTELLQKQLINRHDSVTETSIRLAQISKDVANLDKEYSELQSEKLGSHIVKLSDNKSALPLCKSLMQISLAE